MSSLPLSSSRVQAYTQWHHSQAALCDLPSRVLLIVILVAHSFRTCFVLYPLKKNEEVF